MLIEAFAKSNNDNANIILIFYSNFEKYIGYGLGAMRCLIRLIQNNPYLLNSICTSLFKNKSNLIDLMFNKYEYLKT